MLDPIIYSYKLTTNVSVTYLRVHTIPVNTTYNSYGYYNDKIYKQFQMLDLIFRFNIIFSYIINTQGIFLRLEK